MTIINIQFADASKATIVAFFGSPQDPQVFPNQGTVEAADARWKTYYDTQSLFAQMGMPKPE